MTNDDIVKEKKRAEKQAESEFKAANPIPVVVVNDDMICDFTVAAERIQKTAAGVNKLVLKPE